MVVTRQIELSVHLPCLFLPSLHSFLCKKRALDLLDLRPLSQGFGRRVAGDLGRYAEMTFGEGA